MKNGIKPINDFPIKHYLHLTVTILDIRGGYAANILVTLNKVSSDYVSPDHGASSDHLPYAFMSSKDGGIFSGSTKSHLLGDVETVLDDFILAYLEANLDVSSPQNSYNTPNPTPPTSNRGNTPLLPRLP